MVYDIAVIGAGVVGMSVAMQLTKKFPDLAICVIEKEAQVATHQTGRNSGVIHSGIYYKPGSLKARTCQAGIHMLHAFCSEQAVPFETTGKIIVALEQDELAPLQALFTRGQANGINGLRMISAEEIKEREPFVSALQGLLVPTTGIVDYTAVVEAYLKLFCDNGGDIFLNTKLKKVTRSQSDIFTLITSTRAVESRTIINCAGLFSDRVALLCGVDPGLRIIPFRGEYYKISASKAQLVNNLIYPVPNPQFPFLGVHFTRMVDGERELGPNAVLALKREGYTKTSFSMRDALATFTYPAFWHMASKYWKMGAKEMYMSLHKKALVRQAQKIIPDLRSQDLVPATSGVRAQALKPGGVLADDFEIKTAKNMLHILNAPSPAATASLAIGEQIIEMAQKSFDCLSE
ncbi:L-2-hydroxyglutarate oxidase [Oligoflexia bacterium]|nr:L-2-hydroxyglutarate oxidase [Oligoflexia bacterium]